MENQIYDDLKRLIPKENIKINEPMSKHTSFKTGGNADFYITVKNVDEIKRILDYANEKKIKYYVIGNGSNLLVKDEGYRGIILKIDINDIQIDDLKEDDVIVTVGAGVKLMALAQVLMKRGITGFEEL